MLRLLSLEYVLRRAATYQRLCDFILSTFLDIGVSSVCISRFCFIMEQFCNLRNIDYIGGGSMDVINQPGLNVSGCMSFHFEEILVSRSEASRDRTFFPSLGRTRV